MKLILKIVKNLEMFLIFYFINLFLRVFTCPYALIKEPPLYCSLELYVPAASVVWNFITFLLKACHFIIFYALAYCYFLCYFVSPCIPFWLGFFPGDNCHNCHPCFVTTCFSSNYSWLFFFIWNLPIIEQAVILYFKISYAK